MYTRNQTRVISIGDVKIGGGNPVAIQSMTNTKTENVEETVKQILALEKAGCQIIRCTVPTMKGRWNTIPAMRRTSNNESCRSFYRD